MQQEVKEQQNLTVRSQNMGPRTLQPKLGCHSSRQSHNILKNVHVTDPLQCELRETRRSATRFRVCDMRFGPGVISASLVRHHSEHHL